MARKPKEQTVDDAPYEQVMERLAATVESLERGEMSLEEQIRCFEEGVALVRRGQALLDAAERKVEILLKGEETAAFESPDGEDAPGRGDGSPF
jgi:exodeoxyribonuclease VII small subunit